MATTSPGPQKGGYRVQKWAQSSRKKKNIGTLSTKKHRFEPFSQRIARLKIDPVRRGDTNPHQNDDHESYFVSAFSKWKDANLSENFTLFARQIGPLCQSLPQVLLYQQDIIDLVFEFVEKADALCLEPLLDLITQLARDLGSRYEDHFERTVVAVTKLAATHESVEVIEWAFTCLAWLFKYLSRLLVFDLRPLYDLMAPFLGRERHKPFVSRFSAESMSFLVRKAAAQYHKDAQPLSIVVNHVFEDVSNTSFSTNISEFQEGLVIFFAEAIKGVQKGTHSSSTSIIHALLAYLTRDSPSQTLASASVIPIIEAIIIDVIHHTDAPGFSAIQNEFLETFSHIGPEDTATFARLLSVILGTRKGTRISDWSSVTTKILGLIDGLNDRNSVVDTVEIDAALRLCASVLQYAPLESATTFSTSLFLKIDKPMWQNSFLPFSTFVIEAGKDRFELLVLPELRRFIVAQWENYETEICRLLPALIVSKSLPHEQIHIPKDWNNKMMQHFSTLTHISASKKVEYDLSLCHGYLDLLRFAGDDTEARNQVAETLFRLFEDVLSKKGSCEKPLEDFAACNGFDFATRQKGLSERTDLSISTALTAIEVYGQTTVFLKALGRMLLETTSPVDLSSSECSSAAGVLCGNLASSSSDLRQSSLDAFAALYVAGQVAEPPVLVVLRNIENSAFTVENVRKLSLNIRKLASLYQDGADDHWMRESVPAYCFGLLHAPLTPLLEDACNTLREISQFADSEGLIIDRALLWLEEDSNLDLSKQEDIPEDNQPLGQNYSSNFTRLQNFRCSNLDQLDESAAAHWKEFSAATTSLDQLRKQISQPASLASPNNRSQGLRVLRTLPYAAEKRSRILVPILLNWVHGMEFTANDDTEAGDLKDMKYETFTVRTQDKWTRKDQKALLALFEQFSNPNVLFRSGDVYEGLKALLCNGDMEIQRSATKALLAWKQPFLLPYRENLLNLLDDARFREELTVFIDTEDADKIRPEHRLELMPILLRLLYGRVTTRTGLGGPRGTQGTRRKAVLVAVTRFGQMAVNEFIQLALGPLNNLDDSVGTDENMELQTSTQNLMPVRKAAGMLRMLQDMIVTFSDQIAPFSKSIARAIMYCLIRCNQSRHGQEPDDQSNERVNSLLKPIRQEAISCLSSLYVKCPAGEWTVWLQPILFREIIDPRVENLPNEVTQSVSNLFRLFSTWAASAETARLLVQNPLLLPKVSECLVTPAAKTEVKRFVLKEILKPFVDAVTAAGGMGDASELLSPDLAHTFLSRLSEFLLSAQEKDLVEASVEIAINLQSAVTGFKQSKALVELVLQLLSQPSRQISPRLKGQLLELLKHFIPDLDWAGEQKLYILCVRSISRLFNFFNDGPNRLRVVSTFRALSQISEELRDPLVICEKLNSFSTSRVDEPNYELREQGFQAINEGFWSRLSPLQWLPIVSNLLFFIKDQEELSTRAGATSGLRRFVEAFRSSSAPSHDETVSLKDILEGTIIPAVQAGMSESSELVRAEYVTVLTEIVRSGYEPALDMQSLLGPDEESSFFNNIVHIQSHRRMRALHRLSSESVSISNLNIGRFLIPLLEGFLNNKEGDAHNLVAAATTTLEHLASGLDWHKYRALLHRKMQDPKSFESKAQIRVIGALISALYNSTMRRRPREDISVAIQGKDDDAGGIQMSTCLTLTLPDESALHKSLSNSILKKMMDQIHYQDESSLDIRILIATFVVKLILVFPQENIHELLPTVLIDVCNILKSRSQEARDSARKTLSDIAAIIGPEYFGFLVKQLRTALKRGFQLHVLSFTAHSLLVSISSSVEVGSLDYCLPGLVGIVMDDTFGVISQDKEAAGYISSAKEVKRKALGFDSMEILASLVTLPRLNTLLGPISSQLERIRPRLEKIDELLRRIREGLRKNPHVNSRDVLTLSFEILKENVPEKNSIHDMNVRSKKMAVFSLELMRRSLDKHENLKTVENLAGFMPLFATSAAQQDDEIRMSLFRLLASIIKVPLQELDEYAGRFISEARQTIENAASTNELLSQAALRLCSAILRERPEAAISQASFETDVAFLLGKIKPDLEEPGQSGERDRQIAAFNFIKAVMGRGVMVPEIYEVMNVVRQVMLKSQQAPIPELSRSIYSRFILDYFPGQGKGLAKQVDFLTVNLQYEHPRSRLSVMEVMAFMLGRMDTNDVQEVLVSFFLPLVLVLVVDQDQDCRNAAEALLLTTFERADMDRVTMFKEQTTKWMASEGSLLWQKASLKIWGIYFREHSDATKEANTVSRHARDIIESGETEEDETAASQQLLPGALDLIRTLSSGFPNIVLAKNTSAMWASISSHLASGDTQVRATAVELIGIYLADFARTAARLSNPQKVPLQGSNGLVLTTDELSLIIPASMALLESETHGSETIEKTVKNLVFIARVCGATEKEADMGEDQVQSDGAGILAGLLHEISEILRAEINISRAPTAKVACLKVIAALYKVVQPSQLEGTLREVLLPLQHLTDSSRAAPRSADPQFEHVYGEMVSLAAELQGQIREKVGPEVFLKEITAVQQIVRERRAERKAKRFLDTIAEPERAERVKRKKRTREMEKRRERNSAAAGRRRGW